MPPDKLPKDLTDEEIVAYVCGHFISKMSPPAKKGTSCAYCSKKLGSCAVGILIPEDAGKRWDTFSCNTIEGVSRTKPEEYTAYFRMDQLPLLKALQFWHDSRIDRLPTQEERRDSLCRIFKARDIDVSIPELTQPA